MTAMRSCRIGSAVCPGYRIRTEALDEAREGRAVQSARRRTRAVQRAHLELRNRLAAAYAISGRAKSLAEMGPARCPAFTRRCKLQDALPRAPLEPEQQAETLAPLLLLARRAVAC